MFWKLKLAEAGWTWTKQNHRGGWIPQRWKGPPCWSLPFPLFRPSKPEISAKSVSRSHWGRVNKLEPIKIRASISSSLFSVFCGMSWQGWAAPGKRLESEFQYANSKSSWKGANVKIGTMSLIHSILRDLDSYKPLLGIVQTHFLTRGYRIPVIWPSPSLVGALSSSSSGSATDLLASRQLRWMILMRLAYLGCAAHQPIFVRRFRFT